MDLIDRISKTHDTKAGDAVAAFFDAANMPIPQSCEYTITAEDGFIVFLDDPACVLRGIPKNKSNTREAPSLISPLLSKSAANINIDLYPGVRTPIDPMKVYQLIFSSRTHGYNYWDIAPANGGYLPLSTPKYPHGIPIVIDHGAVTEAFLTTYHIRTLLKKHGILKSRQPENPQDALYKELREHFHNAWPDTAKTPDHALLDKAWALCVSKTKEEIKLHDGTNTTLLTADWKNMGQKGKKKEAYKNAKRGGALYAKRWQCPTLETA